LPKQRLWL